MEPPEYNPEVLPPEPTCSVMVLREIFDLERETGVNNEIEKRTQLGA